jgi:hypothetical protein
MLDDVGQAALCFLDMAMLPERADEQVLDE